MSKADGFGIRHRDCGGRLMSQEATIVYHSIEADGKGSWKYDGWEVGRDESTDQIGFSCDLCDETIPWSGFEMIQTDEDWWGFYGGKSV